jgi:radical SAM superfamily enzyme YgiQ (UPF0313 family)
MRTNLLLINPPGEVSKLPIGLLWIASYVRKHGFTVKIIDGTIQDIKKTLLKINHDIHVVGITATTDTILSAYDICEFIKKNISEKIICVVGGFHPTALPKKTLEESMFDIAVVGEGELTMLEILEKIRDKKPLDLIPGTAIKFDKKIKLNRPRKLIEDLNTLPFPAYDLIDMKMYFHGIRSRHSNPKRTVMLTVTRGCPYNCIFCASKAMWKRIVRFFSVDYIIKELQFLIQKYKIDGISFFDDELFQNKKFIYELCDSLISTGISKKIIWSCQGRVDTIDHELIRKLKKANCVLIRFGMESGSEDTLKFLKRNTTTVEQNKNAAILCKEENMACFGSFIIGSPFDELDDIVKTINFIQTYMHDNVDVFVMVPYPGTDAWDIYTKNNFLRKDINWSNFIIESKNEYSLPVIRTENFTPEQLMHIKNYIKINVVDPINFGKKVKKRNHRREIEKILFGDTRLAKFTLNYKLRNIFSIIPIAINNPKKVIHRIIKR